MLRSLSRLVIKLSYSKVHSQLGTITLMSWHRFGVILALKQARHGLRISSRRGHPTWTKRYIGRLLMATTRSNWSLLQKRLRLSHFCSKISVRIRGKTSQKTLGQEYAMENCLKSLTKRSCRSLDNKALNPWIKLLQPMWSLSLWWSEMKSTWSVGWPNPQTTMNQPTSSLDW